ncbi:hypothetical protein Vi05172_g5141 [Venturia inaequalis]|nr:hypothetical protein Vi05172_g5141 [Venturia inaequalis]
MPFAHSTITAVDDGQALTGPGGEHHDTVGGSATKEHICTACLRPQLEVETRDLETSTPTLTLESRSWHPRPKAPGMKYSSKRTSPKRPSETQDTLR